MYHKIMNKKCKEAIRDDLYRKYGKRKFSFFELATLSNSSKMLILLRRYQFSHNSLSKFFLKLRLRHYRVKTGNEIRPETNFGRGLLLIHEGPRFISPNATIGNNVNLMQGVTIGSEWRGKRIGAPVIGDRVWLGPFSVLTGKIKIGDNVLVAGGAFVNFDVPNDSIVIGNPAKIIHSESATEHYVENLVS